MVLNKLKTKDDGQADLKVYWFGQYILQLLS